MTAEALDEVGRWVSLGLGYDFGFNDQNLPRIYELGGGTTHHKVHVFRAYGLNHPPWCQTGNLSNLAGHLEILFNSTRMLSRVGEVPRARIWRAPKVTWTCFVKKIQFVVHQMPWVTFFFVSQCFIHFSCFPAIFDHMFSKDVSNSSSAKKIRTWFFHQVFTCFHQVFVQQILHEFLGSTQVPPPPSGASNGRTPAVSLGAESCSKVDGFPSSHVSSVLLLFGFMIFMILILFC